MSAPCQRKCRRGRSRAGEPADERTIGGVDSWAAVLHVVEELADFGEFGGGGFFGGKGLEDEAVGGAVEDAVQEVAEEAALGVALGEGGVIDVGSAGFVAGDQSFFGHDLQHFQDGGVAGLAGAAEFGMDFADGARAVAPEDGEDGEFAVGGFGEGTLGHGGMLFF